MFIESLDIFNFKSIQEARIPDIRRINLFIGRPNVGKSNILEALSMFSLPYLGESTPKKLNSLVRLENEAELFYNGDVESDGVVHTNLGTCRYGYHPKSGLNINLDFLGYLYVYKVVTSLQVKGTGKHEAFDPPIKKYSFKHDVKYRKGHAQYLIPPFGSNLLNIIEEYSELKRQVTSLFNEYGLEIAFDKGSRTIKVVQSKENGELFLVPYNSIADTLQRIIFYKAAITSNNNSVLLFEEPEAHSFPPYMTHLTQEMIHKKDNQFFIATHSPFILNDLLENAREELSVFVVSYQDRQTHVKPLSSDELHNVFQYGVDLFTNNESFI